jgi:hypothetical protein
MRSFAPMSPPPPVVPAGTRVQIHYTLLTAEERSPNLPEDTRALPYEVRAKGLLIADGREGERVTIRTQAGREIAGTLVVVDPGDDHGFGRPQPALVRAIGEITALREELAR